jgi:hypothetical protein
MKPASIKHSDLLLPGPRSRTARTIVANDNSRPLAANDNNTYDRTGQINFASGTYGTSTVTYDSNSNRLTAGGFNYINPGSSNRLKKWSVANITYTSAGNIAAIAGDTLTYNKANQMATATVSGTASSYFYDAFGNRLKLKTTTPYQLQMYDLWGHMLTETSAASPVETDYV